MVSGAGGVAGVPGGEQDAVVAGGGVGGKVDQARTAPVERPQISALYVP